MELLYKDTEWQRLAKISKSTSIRWRKKGIGPKPIRVGPKAIRYRATEVHAFLEGRASDTEAATRC